MTPEEWKKIKQLFNAAAELSATERAVFLVDGCGDARLRREVEKMLEAEEAEKILLDRPIMDLKSVWQPEAPETIVGRRIGDFRIVREIGRGGMGAVYEAVRDDGEFAQRVALKLIKRGMDTDEIVRRFRHERQILASLEHPNIARLIDGGISDEGAPFYAMEFVKGIPVDEFCRRNNLSVAERLALFRQICAAVSFAHSRLVVHRDLKPSNILVTNEGNVKLLDFGIAKVLSSEDTNKTATQFGLMTPAYASPEQARGENVTTATDVYSLGTILYELLTGENPHRINGKSHGEIVKAVCETQPERPSSVARRSLQKTAAIEENKQRTNPKSKIQNPKSLRGDLDNIVLKALKKEPARRYSSVEALSEDVRQHLAGLPISARPDTISYRASKFVRRNRIGVFSALFIFLALLAGISAAVWQRQRAEHQRALAEQRFADVRQLANSFVFKYHDAIAKLPGSTSVREMLVKDAAAYLDRLATDTAGDAVLQRELAAAYLKLGDVQGKIYTANIGDTAGAIANYRKAADLLENVVRQNPSERAAQVDLVRVYDALASILIQRTGGSGEAAAILENALRLQEELSASEPENAEYKLLLAKLYIRVGDAAGAEKGFSHYERALKIAENLFTADSQNADRAKLLAMTEQRPGTAFVRLGDKAAQNHQFPVAAEFYQKALPFHRRSFDAAQKLVEIEPENPVFRRYAGAGSVNLAETLAKCGERETAIQMLETGLKIFERIAAEDAGNREAKFDVSSTHFTFAEMLVEFGAFKEAAAHFERSLKINREIQAADAQNAEVSGQINLINQKLIQIKERLGKKD
ncbi:MAG: protein kinase [Acidobacteriota bacterium]|nr:protein kinase [Acidobacteriota bacterium]